MTGHHLPRVLGPGRRLAMLALVLNGFGQAALAVVSGLAVGRAFTALQNPAPVVADVAVLAAAVAVCGLAVAGLRGTERVFAERAGQSYVHDLRLLLFDHVLAVPARQSARRSTGGTALRFTSDLAAFRRWVSLGLARLVVAIPLLVGVLGFFAWLAWPLALGTAAGIAAGLTAYAVLSVGLRRSDRVARRRRGRLAADVTERIAVLPAVAANGAQHRERARVHRRSTQLWQAELNRSRHVGALRAAAEAAAALAMTLYVVAAAAGQVAAADVAAALVVLTVVLTPLRDLGRVHEYRASYRVAADRVNEVLSRPTRPSRQDHALPAGKGELLLDGVSVDGCLRDVSVTAFPGQVVTVCGANGAGKSTLVQLLCGLLVPDSGSVRLDGVEIGRVRPHQLRAAVGVVGPDFPLLRGSVRRNLCYRVPDASPAEVARVRRLVRLDDALAGLARRERTRLGDRGAGLSSGQQTRLALGRALLGQPRLLLLDEADAHLDAETVRVLRDAVASFGGTVVCVSHAPELRAIADVIWQVEDGMVTTRSPANDPGDTDPAEQGEPLTRMAPRTSCKTVSG